MKVLSLLLLVSSVLSASAKSAFKTGSKGYAKLDDRSFRELTQAPREHYAIVLLTALGTQFNCVFCKEFDPEFAILAQSWQKTPAKQNESEVYFGHMDFSDGQDTFRTLQLVSAPNLWIFPPTIDHKGKVTPGDPMRYDFGNSPGAEAAAAFISRSINRDFVVRRPFNYAKAAKFFISILVTVATLAILYKVAGFVLLNKNFWAVISLLAILIFNAGHMFTQIRNSPYSRGDGYIAGGFQDQFGAETHIVAMIYGILAFSVITLAISVPRIRSARTQAVLITVWVVVQFLVFSFLIQLFRQKNGGYPFKLLL